MSESAPVTIDAGPEESAPSPIPDLEHELIALKERHLLLQAEFENFRKRKSREADEIRRFALDGILRDLLPILDHFELALDPNHDRTAPDWGTGIELIFRQILDLLKTQGLLEITPNPGDAFDHSLHAAIATERSAIFRAECVTRVTRKGYLLKDRLLRAAQVVIAEAAQETAPIEDPADV